MAVDESRCTTLVQIGYPGSATLDALAKESLPAKAPARVSAAADTEKTGPTPPSDGGGAYGEGYYQVQWEDWANIDVTKVRASLQWSWNGSCADWAAGWPHWWWRGESGWRILVWDHRLRYEHGCRVIVSDSDANYVNDARYFCSNDVYQGNYDIQAYGNEWGQFGGGFWSSWASHCDNGPDLHFRDFLVRVQ